MKQSGYEIINDLFVRYPALEVCREDITKAAELICRAYGNGKKLLLCGNGGSASDSQHIVGELMKEFAVKRPLPENVKYALKCAGDNGYMAENLQGGLPAISLVGVTSLESAYANDAAPDLAFAQQVLALGKEGDVLLGITTSGNSANVIYATRAARAIGVTPIILTGGTGGKIKSECECAVVVPAKETYKVQEYHLPVYHTLCLAVENEFFGK